MMGEILDRRYQINEILGAGGFGQTYLALDTKLPGNPTCVVKQLKPVSNESATLQVARRLFASEAQVLQQLGNHDQIPRLLAYFEENQEFFLVQEFIDGHPLSAELTPGIIFAESDAIALLQSILEPLAFVHQRQIIHRDIKPANLIRRNQDGKIVLIDFGAVKEIAVTQMNAQGQNRLTVGIGTPGYMPSEQTRGIPRLSSDVYAVGIIGIQALTGLTPDRLLEDSVTGEIAWRHHAQVSNWLADILDNMVRYDFRHRYQSAVDVLQALQQSQPPTIIPAATTSLNELILEWFENGQQGTQRILENQPTKNPGTFRIGRDPAACDLVLAAPTVSRQHAEIFFNAQQHRFYVRSLNQNNPPVVDGQALPIGEVVLHEGSILRLGQIDFRVTGITRNQFPPGYVPPQPDLPLNVTPFRPPDPTKQPPRNPLEPQYPPQPVQQQYRQESVQPQGQQYSTPVSGKQTQVGAVFWIKWVLMNFGGLVVGAILASAISNSGGYSTLLVFGLFTGIFQWLALQGVVNRPWLWGLVTGAISITFFGWFVVVPVTGILLFRQLRSPR